MLERQVKRFREWASLQVQAGEWETYYPHWDDLYAAVLPIALGVSPAQWDEETATDVLYVLARDNEDQRIVEDVSEDGERMLAIAELALQKGEHEARWQVAAYLSNVPQQHAEAAEHLLLRFVTDEDEYVRRRAMLALSEMPSSHEHAERLAFGAWETEEEYQRIAALVVLSRVKSPRLREYLLRAREDGRRYVVENAERIEAGRQWWDNP